MIANAEELLELPNWLGRVWVGFRAWEQQHALSDPYCELTYGALAARVRGAVALLDTMEVPPGAVVAVVAAKQVNSVVWLLALLESGRVYLPLDPAQPASFNRDVLADAGCHVVVEPDQVPDGASASQRATTVVNQSESPAAYCILTSGTTGRPRLAFNCHRALALLADNIGRIATVAVGTRVAVNAPLCFDASLKQIAMLALGASVYLLPAEDRANPQLLVQRLRAKRIEALDVTPMHLRFLIHSGLLDLGVANLPSDAEFGDGTPIPDEVIDQIHAAYQRHSVALDWKPGDLVMLDNQRFAHGRAPYDGRRRVLVAMGELVGAKAA